MAHYFLQEVDVARYRTRTLYQVCRKSLPNQHTPVVAGNAPAVAGNAPAVAGHTPAVAGHTPAVASASASASATAVRGSASTQLTAQNVTSYDMQQVEQHAIDADLLYRWLDRE